MARIKRDPKTVALAQEIAKQFDPQSAEDADEALKELFGPIFESLLQGEMSHHLGYENNNKEYKQTQNRRNGYGQKTVHTTKGDITIDTPREGDGSFEPQLISKRQRDVSGIEDIYGFSISHEMVSDITDAILPELEEWRNRPLKKCYAFLFVDCMYVTLRSGYEAKECAVYTILGYDLNGHKDILGLWLSESESKNYWMQIFDELKARGIEDVFFMSMDGVSGLEEGAKAIFPKIIVQRCIVHLIRNSIKYVPSKDYKKFTQELKKVYGAPNLKAAAAAFESFCRTWEQYPGAIEVWKRNFKFVEQLYDYGSDVRRIMYTTNAIESINSSFRKVTKKGAFPNENALFKLLYLRCTELEKKWNNGTIHDWSKVLNQLMVNEIFTSRIEKYLK